MIYIENCCLNPSPPFSALLEQQAYFKATFNSGTPKVEPGTVVFDKVLENIGYGYSSATGVFTAGIKGLYFFMVQSFTNGAGDANWDLTVNGQMVLRAESTTQGSTSNEYVYPVVLKVGDKVSVSSRSSIDVWGINHSFFAGYLARAIP